MALEYLFDIKFSHNFSSHFGFRTIYSTVKLASDETFCRPRRKQPRYLDGRSCKNRLANSQPVFFFVAPFRDLHSPCAVYFRRVVTDFGEKLFTQVLIKLIGKRFTHQRSAKVNCTPYGQAGWFLDLTGLLYSYTCEPRAWSVRLDGCTRSRIEPKIS